MALRPTAPAVSLPGSHAAQGRRHVCNEAAADAVRRQDQAVANYHVGMYVGHQTLLAKGGCQIAATLRVPLLTRRQARDVFERFLHLGELGLRVATQRSTVVGVLRVGPVL